MEYIGWKVATFTCRFLSRPVTILLSDFLGWFLWRVCHVRKQIILNNLNIAFGKTMTPAEIDELALRTFQNTLLTFFEFLSPSLVGNYGDVINDCEGEENGLPFVNKQALCLLAHIGNWEAQSRIPQHYGNVKFKAFVKPMHNPLVNREIVEQRRKWGVEIIPSTKFGTEAINNGEWIAFLGDQDASRRGIFVDFFGRPASTFKGPAFFSWKFDLPILPLFLVRIRDKNRSMRIICLPPIYPDKTKDKDSEIVRLTQAHTKALESVIRRYPDSYFWLHRRWKTQPKTKTTPATQ